MSSSTSTTRPTRGTPRATPASPSVTTSITTASSRSSTPRAPGGATSSAPQAPTPSTAASWTGTAASSICGPPSSSATRAAGAAARERPQRDGAPRDRGAVVALWWSSKGAQRADSGAADVTMKVKPLLGDEGGRGEGTVWQPSRHAAHTTAPAASDRYSAIPVASSKCVVAPYAV